MSAVTNVSEAVQGEFISGHEVVTVTEKAARLAALFVKANEGMTEACEAEASWDSMQAVLLEALRQIPERDDRESMAVAYRKAQQRERDRMAYLAVKLRAGEEPLQAGESFDDALLRLRRFKWLTDTMTVSMKTAKLDQVAVGFKAIASYIPPVPVVSEDKGESVTVTETKPEDKGESVTVTETKPEDKGESVTVTETVPAHLVATWQARAIEAEAKLSEQGERIKALESRESELLAALDKVTLERNALETECKALKFDAKPKRTRKAS